MFGIQTSFSNLYRYKVRTILSALVSAMAVIFMNVYAENLENSRKQFLDLRDKIPVEVSVTTLDGRQEQGLYIKEKLYEAIKMSPHVKDAEFALELSGESEGRSCRVLAVETMPGYEGEFLSDGDTCVISAAFSREKGLEAGDSFTFMLESYEPEPENRLSYLAKPLEEITYEVGAVAEDVITEAAIEEVAVADGNAEIVISMETARKIFQRNHREFRVSSASFYVKNPLELNQFKEEMKAAGFVEAVPKAMARVDGNALVVKDGVFIRAAEHLEEGERLRQAFFPVICVALAAVGFVVSCLLMEGRQMEYALMRIMGVSRTYAAAVYLLEQGTAQAAGILMGSAVSAGVIQPDGRGMAGSAWVVFFCFFMGTAVSLWNFGREGILQLVTRAE